MSHPIWGLGFVFLSVFLLWGLLRAIAQFIEKLWLIVLRSPLNLGRWLLKTLRRLFNDHRAVSDSEETPTPQIDEIAERLERLQEEQKQLLLDVKLLIAQQKRTDREGDRP